jgi:hypothetical protein
MGDDGGDDFGERKDGIPIGTNPGDGCGLDCKGEVQPSDSMEPLGNTGNDNG